MTLYLLDANVLIRAHEDYYPVDRIPQYWTWLLEKATADIIKMPRRIFAHFKTWRLGRNYLEPPAW